MPGVINLGEVDNQQLDPASIEGLVRTTAQKFDLDPDRMARLARQESTFNQKALSPKGAIGVMQLMPGTAKELGVDPHDVYQNIEGGMRYYKNLFARFGDHDKATAAYNAGPARVASNRELPPETQQYVAAVNGEKKSVATGPVPRLINLADLDESPDYSKLPPPAALDPQTYAGMAGDFAKGAGRAVNNRLDALLGMFNPMMKMTGPVGWAASGLMGGAGEAIKQNVNRYLDPQVDEEGNANFPKDSAEAAKQIYQSVLSNFGGKQVQEATGIGGAMLGKSVYTHMLGASTPEEKAIAEEMLRRRIPLGIGMLDDIASRKAIPNKALNDVIAKYTPPGRAPFTQTPGLVPTGAAGQPSAQQGAALAKDVVSKTDLYKTIESVYKSNKNIPQAEVDGFKNAFQNFLGRQDEHIGLADAREIKQYIQTKVPYGSESEGQAEARKKLAHYLSQKMEEAIPSQAAADRAIFRNSSNELEKLIDIEQKAEKMSKRSRPWYSNPHIMGPAAGAMIGGASGYYQHASPWAAAARSALGAAIMSPTGASQAALLANYLPAQAVASYPARVGIRNSADDIMKNFDSTNDMLDKMKILQQRTLWNDSGKQ